MGSLYLFWRGNLSEWFVFFYANFACLKVRVEEKEEREERFTDIVC